jgi:hypothetical protein
LFLASRASACSCLSCASSAASSFASRPLAISTRTRASFQCSDAMCAFMSSRSFTSCRTAFPSSTILLRCASFAASCFCSRFARSASIRSFCSWARRSRSAAISSFSRRTRSARSRFFCASFSLINIPRGTPPIIPWSSSSSSSSDLPPPCKAAAIMLAAVGRGARRPSAAEAQKTVQCRRALQATILAGKRLRQTIFRVA